MFEKKVVSEQKKALSRGNEEKGGILFAFKALIIPALFAGIVVVLIYLYMTNLAKTEVIKESVVCAARTIDANTYVSSEDVERYFKVVDIEADVLPDHVYGSLDELPEGGFYVEEDLVTNEALRPSDIAEADEVMDKYVEGTMETSFSVNAFDNSVSGTLRHGDIVDVYATDPATNQLILMLQDVYIVAAFDGSGDELTEEYEAENGTETATVFTVKVAPGEIEQMNLAISYEGIQLYLSEK